MVQTILRAVALVAALTVISGCAQKQVAPTHEKSNYFGTTQVHRFMLPNGLKILVLEDHSAPTFAYHTWFKVGSRDEQPGLTGLAHFFEHLMFKQTVNRKEGEFDRILESAGVEGENAFTSRDYTAYVQSLPADKLDLIAGLEAERMVNLMVIDAAVNSEREVVQNERRSRYENNPSGQLYERLYEVAYAKHSYHWPVIGYDKDLKSASRQDFENFYKRFYAPNNATIVVVGDVTPEQVLATVTRHYAALPRSKIDRRESPREPVQETERAETRPINLKVEKLTVGYHIPDVNSVDFPAIEVAREILAGGRGSRLYRKLVDGGIATSVDVESAEHAEPGLLLFFVNLQSGKTAKDALRVIDLEIKEMLSAANIKTEELERAVSMHRYTIFDDQASNHNKAQFLGFYEVIAGKFERGVDIVNALAAVDKKAVARVLKSYFHKDNRSVVIGTPLKAGAK